MSACRWCSGGSHLIATSFQNLPDDDYEYWYSIFHGLHLVDTFTQPEEVILWTATAGASVLYFITSDDPDGRVGIRTTLRDGTLVADHLFAWDIRIELGETLTNGWQDGSLLAMPGVGDTLFVCSPGGRLHSIGLGRPAAPAFHICIRASSFQGLAAVCVLGQQSEVLIVDLAEQRVRDRLSLPASPMVMVNDRLAVKQYAAGYLALALSSCSLAVSCEPGLEGNSREIRVMSLTGNPTSSWVLPGAFSPSFDPLGRFLAVLTPVNLSVYSVSSRVCLAVVTALPVADPHAELQLHWQPQRGELMCVRRTRTPSCSSVVVCGFLSQESGSMPRLIQA